MKRYQCIKNYYVTLTYGQGVTTAAGFKAGKPYNFKNNGEYWEVVDEFGTTHRATDGFMTYFHELPSIDEQEEEEARAVPITTRDAKKISWGCAIIIVTFLTVLALIFFR